jgi:hypothetical protein
VWCRECVVDEHVEPAVKNFSHVIDDFFDPGSVAQVAVCGFPGGVVCRPLWSKCLHVRELGSVDVDDVDRMAGLEKVAEETATDASGAAGDEDSEGLEAGHDV